MDNLGEKPVSFLGCRRFCWFNVSIYEEYMLLHLPQQGLGTTKAAEYIASIFMYRNLEHLSMDEADF